MGIGPNNRNVYMLDYGLARQYVTQSGEGNTFSRDKLFRKNFNFKFRQSKISDRYFIAKQKRF